MARGLILNDGTFRFNLAADVGLGCPNRVDDVQLVQLGYWCKARNPVNPPAPEEKAIYSAVVPGSFYTGAQSDPLTLAILYHAKHRGTVQDGRVSVAGNSGSYDGQNGYMIIALNVNIMDMAGPETWPRIDRMPACPAPLREAVVRVFSKLGK